MVARRRGGYTTAAAAAAAAAAVYPGVVKLQLSPAMARLCHIRHRCAARCRERCESRGEQKTYILKRCTDHPIPRFHHHRRPRRRRRRHHHHHLHHPCHCISLGSPPLELSAPSPPSRAAHLVLDSRHVAVVTLCPMATHLATHRLDVAALLPQHFAVADNDFSRHKEPASAVYQCASAHIQ